MERSTATKHLVSHTASILSIHVEILRSLSLPQDDAVSDATG